MPILRIKNNQTAYEAEKNEELVDICENNNSIVQFGCRAGACGTCRVRVVDHPENLSPIQDDERDFLATFAGSGSSDRLACQCKLLGDVTIEVVDTGNHNQFEKK